MADDKALPPGENQDQGAPDETLEVKSPVPVQSNDSAVEKSPDETQSTVLQDPTRRRDTNTASLKRLRPEDFNMPAETSSESMDNTETVNIKVIKEQKKQFRNMMTSSQTLAVNSDGSPQKPEPAPAPAETQQVSSKATLKIKAPTQETRTESIARPQVETPAPASPKSTLKIKAPAGVAPAQTVAAAKPGATLKIKAPAASPSGQPSPAAQTVKQTAPGRPGKTLKLKQGAPTQQQPAATQRRQSPAAQYAKAPEAADASASPGIAYTIFSVAGAAACIVTLIKICTSMNELYNTCNIFDNVHF